MGLGVKDNPDDRMPGSGEFAEEVIAEADASVREILTDVCRNISRQHGVTLRAVSYMLKRR
ncbi:MAG: hypothetical protein HGA72_09775 [Chlorobiaceae bacterium]|jgi:hypothetical protein|nr:hypothetical protein [Chlorobiaceae bacterium]NTW63874.1 hypothetical protein [Chlorobiaceae bacterium]